MGNQSIETIEIGIIKLGVRLERLLDSIYYWPTNISSVKSVNKNIILNGQFKNVKIFICAKSSKKLIIY